MKVKSKKIIRIFLKKKRTFLPLLTSSKVSLDIKNPNETDEKDTSITKSLDSKSIFLNINIFKLMHLKGL